MTSPNEIYTLSLHDALPIWINKVRAGKCEKKSAAANEFHRAQINFLVAACSRFNSRSAARGYKEINLDRKSTRLNSSHVAISYAVFCLKKKKKTKKMNKCNT